MTISRMTRTIAATTLLTMGASSIGCGYILYPERRGNRGGTIDGGTLVMDLLWLLPGLIPGVVALIVDFSSGAIYVHGGSAVRLSPDGRLAVRLPRSSTPMRLEFRLVTSSQRVLARQSALIGPAISDGQSVELRVGDAISTTATAGTEQVYLEVHAPGGASARFPTSIEAGSRG